MGKATDIPPTPEVLVEMQKKVHASPADQYLRKQYFWNLYAFGKDRFTKGEIEAAIRCLKEMAQFQVMDEAGKGSSASLIFKALKAMRDDESLLQKHRSDMPGLFELYGKLDPKRPDKMHSIMIWLACELKEERSSWFVDFIKLAGLSSFRSEDFQRDKKNGRTYDSLAEKVYIQVSKQIESDRSTRDAEWLLPQLHNIIATVSDNVWLKYHKAKLLMMLGKSNEARAFVKQVLVQKKQEFWAWGLLGGTYYPSDPSKALSCYCKALLCHADPEFFIGVREDLAKLLVDQKQYNEAKTEIEQIARVRSDKKWKIPGQVQTWTNQPWYAGAVAAKNNDTLYKQYAATAEEEFISDYPLHIGVVSWVDHEKKSAFVCFNPEHVARYVYKNSTWEKKPPETGETVEARIREVVIDGTKKYEAVTMDRTTKPLPSGIAIQKTGELKVIEKPNAQSFGFVDDVYVAGALINQAMCSSGTKVSIVAIQEKNKKTGLLGWKAVRVAKAI